MTNLHNNKLREVFAMHITHKGLICLIYKEILRIRKSEEYKQIIHRKRTVLIIREIQIKTKFRSHFLTYWTGNNPKD